MITKDMLKKEAEEKSYPITYLDTWIYHYANLFKKRGVYTVQYHIYLELRKLHGSLLPKNLRKGIKYAANGYFSPETAKEMSLSLLKQIGFSQSELDKLKLRAI